MAPLRGRRALVTGGAKGIGASIARRLASDGASVVIADLDEAGASAVAHEIGGRALELDVSDADAVGAALGGEEPFAILVNNAGVDQHAFFTETHRSDWERLIAINLISVFACTHAVLPGMQDAKHGRIINIASEAGRLGSKGGAVYAAAKGGVIAFTKSIARENGRFAITANVVAPGPIRTPMLEQAVAVGGEKLRQAMSDATLLRRIGEPEDVAALTAFLASDEAGYITGEVIGVSGGMGIGG